MNMENERGYKISCNSPSVKIDIKWLFLPTYLKDHCIIVSFVTEVKKDHYKSTS